MNLIFQRDHKSIKHLPIAEIPDFTIVTGANGSGKTHFLEALFTGAVQIEGIDQNKIKYYNWGNLVTSDEQALQPRQLEENRNANCQALEAMCKGQVEQLVYMINIQHRQQYPQFPAVSITNEQLLTAATASVKALQENVDSYATPQDWLQIGEEIIKYYINNALINFNYFLNTARQNGTANFTAMTLSGSYVNYSINRDQAIVLEKIIQKSQKIFLALTMEDFLSFYPLVATEQDPFIGSLTGLFAGYVMVRSKNATNMALSTYYDSPAPFLVKEDFLATYGPPPWEVFNDVLTKAKLGFRFREPSADASLPLQVRLQHMISGVDLKFSELSSGERILISLAHFLFFSQDPRQPTAMPEVILLDEVDAPLHPAMTVDLLRIITQVMVGHYGRKVVLATHSPSTVALAPEDSIHVMDATVKTLQKVSRDEGVQSLMVGVPTLSIDTANRRQVFVESQHDVALYDRIAEVARPHLVANVSISFIAAGHEKGGGCDLLTSLVKQLGNAGNKAVFGIVDWDGNRVPEGQLRVLGQNVRHSIENYLLDPVLLGALLLREKSEALNTFVKPDRPLLEGRENYFDLQKFDNERLQRVADVVITALGFSLADLVQVSYVNGCEVQVPQEYLQLRGHNLEERIKTVFPELKRFHQEPKLKQEILHKILEEIPELLPADFVTLLADIQGASNN